MAGMKRTDNRGRILRDGESQRSNGTYRYRYVDDDGKRKDVYSHRLVATDRADASYKNELSLREKEKKIQRDLDDGIRTGSNNKVTLNDLFTLYMSGKRDLFDFYALSIYTYKHKSQNEGGDRHGTVQRNYESCKAK